MANSIAPAYVVITYVVDTVTHNMRVPLNPATIGQGGGNTVFTRSGIETPVVAFVTTFVSQIAPLYSATATFTAWEYYTYETNTTTNPIFREAGQLSVVGDNASPNIRSNQLVLSYRTANGGYGKIYLMECALAPDIRGAWRDGSPTALLNDLRANILGSSGCVYGRDNSYPIATLNYTTKVNDALRKRWLGL